MQRETSNEDSMCHFGGNGVPASRFHWIEANGKVLQTPESCPVALMSAATRAVLALCVLATLASCADDHVDDTTSSAGTPSPVLNVNSETDHCCRNVPELSALAMEGTYCDCSTQSASCVLDNGGCAPGLTCDPTRGWRCTGVLEVEPEGNACPDGLVLDAEE
jgi:hypothetical protein